MRPETRNGHAPRWLVVTLTRSGDYDADVKLLKRLHNSVPITEAEIHAAADTLHSMRLVFRASDRKVISSIAKTAQIKILLEEIA